MFVVLSLIVAVVSVCLTFVVVRQRKIDDKMKNFSTPPQLPIIRNMLMFAKLSDILANVLEATRKYGGLLKVDIFYGLTGALVSDRKFLSYLLGTKDILNKSISYNYLKRWLGTGLLTCTGDKWAKSRKMLNPAFHVQMLEKYFDNFHSITDTLIKKLREQCGKGPFDVYPYITYCTLDVICATAMGVTVNAQENQQSSYVKSIQGMCEMIMCRVKSPLKNFDVFYYLSSDYRKEKRNLKVLHDFTNSVIEKRKLELKHTINESTSNQVDEFTSKGKFSFLDLLLTTTVDGRPLTQEEIRDEVSTFLFAGHDTTSAAISFTLYCLATHPEVQQNVVHEIHNELGLDKTVNATYRKVQEMPYLTMVIKESMRLYPPVPIYNRESASDIEYYDGILPKNVSIGVFAFGTHRNPEHFPEPEKFMPERFLNETEMKPYTYIPFSAGPRNCIGQKFAMLEMKLVISKILRHFEVLPVPGYTPALSPLVVLRATNGIMIEVRERH